MADAATTTATAVWNTTVAHRATLIQNHDPALDEQIAAVEEQLLDLAASDLAGVIVKIEILWEGQLHGRDQDSEHKLAVLADLRRLAA
jgi:hypothetical protein